jgi:hypothetical protein
MLLEEFSNFTYSITIEEMIAMCSIITIAAVLPILFVVGCVYLVNYAIAKAQKKSNRIIFKENPNSFKTSKISPYERYLEDIENLAQ